MAYDQASSLRSFVLPGFGCAELKVTHNSMLSEPAGRCLFRESHRIVVDLRKIKMGGQEYCTGGVVTLRKVLDRE